jgi:CarboxypepD_reg-like domain
MRLLLLFCLTIISALTASAQDKTQTIKGRVISSDTREPLIGVNVIVVNSSPIIGAQTDENGDFIIATVPIGRRAIQVSYVGYETFTSEEFILNPVKEIVINVEMKGSESLEAVEVVATQRTNAAMNELAVVSARSFSVEETERIPTAANDPGRMAMAYPGVAQGRDDSENQIIIRGNSPFGILWRLEGVDIPNPNHFALPGSSGGGITVFSAQLLSRSDFYTGGMPAEFGNCMSGAFDIRFRKGNLDKREYRAKAGILGLDFATEGPIKKGKSSYLVNYRYSTLGLLNYAGVYLVGPRVINAFQDLSFNVVNYSKNGKNTFTVFGLGGMSLQHNQPVADPLERDLSKPREVQDWLRPSNTGTLGVTYTVPVGNSGYLKWVAAGIGSFIGRTYDTLSLQDVRYNYQSARYVDKRLTSSLTYNVKIGRGLRLKAGLSGSYIAYEAFKTAAYRGSLSNINTQQSRYGLIFDGKGNTQTAQGFASINYSFNPKLSANLGFNSMFLFFNQTRSFDPRASIKYQLTPKQSLSFAIGQYSQMMALPVYTLNPSFVCSPQHYESLTLTLKKNPWFLVFS